ncbi:site-2 protease family protein [Desulforhabdus amnigena]|uniref:Zinc metalloprotease n=1 Tax=Desulforhabdus amnigena TaxID=40218 RepID=A0A9W6D063_9BACT|nr:site-2 protease family protein [Desulforhabdus amnigena]NLJ29172.1 CBS domain-containing protein [Deltaproteobacteria bacterium]GLI32863.1 peptidase M50 [Desulforhabdus amnigena]
MPSKKGEVPGREGINLFRIAGIQITIDFSWFIIFILILWSLSVGYFPKEFPGQNALAYWFAGLIATLLFFLSVVIHELSHSLMAIRLGMKINEITLFIFGGISKLSEEARTPQDEFKIAVVGPLSSFALAIVFRGAAGALTALQFSFMAAVFSYLSWINVALGVFNLIPGFPLDGGRVLRAFLWWKTGSIARATKWTSDIGKGFAVALMVIGTFQIFSGRLLGGIWMIFIGMFLRWVAEGGYQEVLIRQALEGVSVREVMVTQMVSVSPEMKVSDLISSFFLKYGYTGYPVMENDEILGVVSLSQVKDLTDEEKENRKVREIMTALSKEICVGPEDSLADALKKMIQQNMSRLLVLDKNQVVGLITKTGLFRFIEIKRLFEG